jgi:hypothetical protein
MRTSAHTIGVAVILLSGLVGCRSTTPPPTAQHTEVSPYVRRDATPAAKPNAAPAPSDTIISSPTDPAPGTAGALAMRAATYAKDLAPLPDKRHEKTKPAASDWPDPDAMQLTAQAAINPPKAVANSELVARPQSPETGGPPPSASINLPTVHKLITGAGPDNARAQAPGEDLDAVALRDSSRARDYPAELSAQMDDQLVKYLRDESVPDMSTLAGLAPEDRELLGAMLDALSNFRSQLRADNNMLFSKKIRPLVELSDRLRGQAELSVPTVALCTKVNAYGVYEPMDPARFIAGQRQEAIVYCEVENFLSQPNDKNLYETKLTEDVVLYTESSGLPVWSASKDTVVDQARRRRHDFFLGKRIVLPSNLTIGRYLLKVTIEDQQARHIAENTVPVEIVAQ